MKWILTITLVFDCHLKERCQMRYSEKYIHSRWIWAALHGLSEWLFNDMENVAVRFKITKEQP